MKTKLFIAAILLTASTFAEKVKESEVPAKVKEAFAKKYAGIFKLHFTSIFEFSFDLSMQRLTINRLSSCLLTEVIWDFTKED